jgi:hypothetical protein
MAGRLFRAADTDAVIRHGQDMFAFLRVLVVDNNHLSTGMANRISQRLSGDL